MDCFGLTVMSALDFSARVALRAHNIFLRFTSGATPANHLVASMAANLLFIHLLLLAYKQFYYIIFLVRIRKLCITILNIDGVYFEHQTGCEHFAVIINSTFMSLDDRLSCH